jgi:ribonuclease P protein component
VRGEEHLTRKAQFDLVFREGKSWAGKPLVMRARPNGLELSRYGFTVSRRVGKAVVRNRVRRRLREILRTLTLTPGWDIVFIARVPAAEAGYAGLSLAVRELLRRAGLIKEYEGISPGVN